MPLLIPADKRQKGQAATRGAQALVDASACQENDPVLSALAPAGGNQSSWGTLLLVLGGMNRDAVPGMSINGRQASV